MDKTTVMAEFNIWGDKFDPQIITDNLKIKPTRSWIKEIDKRPQHPSPNPKNLVRIKDPELKVMLKNINDKIKASGKKPKHIQHDFSYWKVDTGYQESKTINNQIIQIYDLLKDKVDVLKELNTKNELTYRLGIVINIEDNDGPGMFFDTYIIDFLHDIGATIDVDYYIYS
jgi:hypothetical protein